MLAPMTDAKPHAARAGRPRLWTPAGFREDEWSHAESAEALAGNGRFILPLQAFLGLDPEQRDIGDRERLGVLLAARRPARDRSSTCSISFRWSRWPSRPSTTDASFSKAELLRSRHHFEGPIRATGQVLIDQLPHMLRLGFDEFEVSHPVLIGRLEKGDVGGLGIFYQPTSATPGKPGRYSWRRR